MLLYKCNTLQNKWISWLTGSEGPLLQRQKYTTWPYPELNHSKTHCLQVPLKSSSYFTFAFLLVVSLPVYLPKLYIHAFLYTLYMHVFLIPIWTTCIKYMNTLIKYVWISISVFPYTVSSSWQLVYVSFVLVSSV